MPFGPDLFATGLEMRRRCFFLLGHMAGGSQCQNVTWSQGCHYLGLITGKEKRRHKKIDLYYRPCERLWAAVLRTNRWFLECEANVRAIYTLYSDGQMYTKMSWSHQPRRLRPPTAFRPNKLAFTRELTTRDEIELAQKKKGEQDIEDRVDPISNTEEQNPTSNSTQPS